MLAGGTQQPTFHSIDGCASAVCSQLDAPPAESWEVLAVMPVVSNSSDACLHNAIAADLHRYVSLTIPITPAIHLHFYLSKWGLAMQYDPAS